MVDSPAEGRRSSTWGTALIAGGLVLIALGITWKVIVPETVLWSEANAQEWEKAQKAAHDATIGHRPGDTGNPAAHRHGTTEHAHGAASDVEIEAAKANADEWQRRLDRARGVSDNGGVVLTLLGAVASLGGVWLLRGQ